MPGAASEWIAELNQVAILEEVSSEIGHNEAIGPEEMIRSQ